VSNDHELIRWAIYFNVVLFYAFLATVVLSPKKFRTRDRLTQAELHELDRRIAVARLRDELAPRIARWRRWRWVRRVFGR
jgi:hypothetical protein